MIDSHCHVSHEQFETDVDETIERAKKANVKAIINVGGNTEDNGKVMALSEKYKGYLFPCVSISPHFIDNENLKDALSYIRKNEKKIVAIGEIGLEYFHFGNKKHRETQKEFLIAQMNLAEEISKPVVIHCREAHEDLMEIMKSYGKVRTMMHCFLKDELAEECIKRGYYLSLPTINCKARDNIIKAAPIENLLAETDSPYLWRGRNEPSNVSEVYGRIAKVRKESLEKIEKQIDANARKFFGLNE